ncbi:DUF2065 domain-containing protein [Tabrizicola sp.]|uniref:DUF2065 domain-containing protein n=1 Tax=Tabrizicola sp. TaxID=2005166 RepID=UPI003D2C4C3A
MSVFVMALGLVFVIEGLVLALAPSRLEQIVEMLAALSRDQRRALGLLAVALGVGLVLLARFFGA